MAFVKVGKASDVPPGTAKVFEVGDRAVAVCNVDGDLFAVDDVCTHDEGSLEQGDVDGYEIECPRHGARFDVRTGQVKALPAVVPIDTFKVRVEGEDIEIEV
jgi:3-phenylpropionate/trans-cinnamate dioxygenase ferredoxin subunit